MKKILGILVIIILAAGCTGNQVKTGDDITKIEAQRNQTNEDVQKLAVVVKDRSFSADMRKRAFALLVRNDYGDMRALLEQMLPGETALKEDFLRESLKYKNFNYAAEDKNLVLEMLLETKDKRQMITFFNMYTNEPIKITTEMVSLIDEAVFIKSDEDAEKMNNLILISDNFDLFKKYVYKSNFKFLEFFAQKKLEWVEKVVLDDKELFMKIKFYLNSSNYDIFKKMVYYYLEDKSGGMETVAAEVIVDMEGNTEEKLLSDNYFIQLSAIRKYGIDESKAYLEKNIGIKNKNLFRALAFLKSTRVFDALKVNYEENHEQIYLEYIYMLDDINAQKYFAKEFAELDTKEKIALLHKIILYDQTDVISLTYKLITEEKNQSSRVIYLDFLVANASDFFIKKASELMESPKYSAEEKKYIKDKLAEVAGEDTKDQILKSVENRVYMSKLNEEKGIVAFSGKLKMWQEYNKIFPDSFFKEEIDKKTKSYENYLEKIKEEMNDSKSVQVKQINESIAEYKEQMQKETNMDRIKFYREKITALEKEKINIEKKTLKSDKDKLMEMESEYVDIAERTNSISSQIYTLESQSDGKNSQAAVAMRDTLTKLMTRRSELLEKIIIFYGYYIDKYGRENLNQTILRDIDGINK